MVIPGAAYPKVPANEVQLEECTFKTLAVPKSDMWATYSESSKTFLVYEFLEGGSLKELLSNKEEAIGFTWIKRANIVKGVADALSYMHHHCSLPIVHRDISSKNILLDSECVAHISDFGTARLLKPDSSNWTSFAGTFGYAAPGNNFFPIRMLIPLETLVSISFNVV